VREIFLVEKEPIWKRGILDLAAIFFLIGGIIILMTVLMMIPIENIYPFELRTELSFSQIIVLIVIIICSIESFECFNFASKRMLEKAGVRGIVIGAILLTLGSLLELKTQALEGSSILILISGIISYIYRK
jgi:hypothetical protein